MTTGFEPTDFPPADQALLFKLVTAQPVPGQPQIRLKATRPRKPKFQRTHWNEIYINGHDLSFYKNQTSGNNKYKPSKKAKDIANPPLYYMPGDPPYEAPRTTGNDDAPLRVFLPASQNIPTSARQAAQWIADHHPEAVAAVGYDQFINDRIDDILQGIFRYEYWEQAEWVADHCETSIPDVVENPVQQNPPLGDPNRKRSKPSWTNKPLRYNYDDADGTPGKEKPGYTGKTESKVFKDKRHTALASEFKLPREMAENEYIPIFTFSRSTTRVRASKRPTKVQFATKTHCVLCDEDHPDRYDSRPIEIASRYYGLNYPMPSDPPPDFDGSIDREYTIDVNVQAAWRCNKDSHASHCIVKQAPAPSRGIYFADSDEIETDFDAEHDVYMARDRPAGPPPNYQAITASTQFTGWTESNPTRQWWAHEYVDIPWYMANVWGLPQFQLNYVHWLNADFTEEFSQPQGTGRLPQVNSPASKYAPGWYWQLIIDNNEFLDVNTLFQTTIYKQEGYHPISLPGPASLYNFPITPSPDYLEDQPVP
jgi:hypothetical protein